MPPCFFNENYFKNYFLMTFTAQMVKNLPAMWETRFNPWVRKTPWRRELLLTPVFLLGEFYGQRLQAIGSQGVGHYWATNT